MAFCITTVRGTQTARGDGHPREFQMLAEVKEKREDGLLCQ